MSATQGGGHLTITSMALNQTPFASLPWYFAPRYSLKRRLQGQAIQGSGIVLQDKARAEKDCQTKAICRRH